jgi:hypothetical protein
MAKTIELLNQLNKGSTPEAIDISGYLLIFFSFFSAFSLSFLNPRSPIITIS